MSSRWPWFALGLSLVCGCADDDDAQRFRTEPLRDQQPSAADAATELGVVMEMRDAGVSKELRGTGGKPARKPDAGQPSAAPENRPARDMMTGSAPVAPAAAHMDPSGLDAGLDDDAGPGGFGPFPTHVDCSGKRGAPGNTTRMYKERKYTVHIPTAANPNTALPVMFVFHGANTTGEQMQVGTGFDILADQAGIVTVYPDGQRGTAPWNVGTGACPPGGFASTSQDDEAYVEQMLADIEQDQCVDKERVFATGFSMGGYFSHELGCKLGKTTFRAIAPHSGGTHSGSCPGAPLPVLLLHGDKDSLISYSCGTRARDYWIERNGCAQDADRLMVTGGYCDFQRGCPADAPVVMCTFNGMDHTWAFPPAYENAGILIWLFFRQFM